MSDALLTKSDLARLLKVSPPTINRMVRARAIPVIKIGPLVRFSLPDVIAYLDRQKQCSQPEAR